MPRSLSENRRGLSPFCAVRGAKRVEHPPWRGLSPLPKRFSDTLQGDVQGLPAL
jgi:hypothetical protein